MLNFWLPATPHNIIHIKPICLCYSPVTLSFIRIRWHPLEQHSCGMLEMQSLLVTHFCRLLHGLEGKAGQDALIDEEHPLHWVFVSRYHWSDWEGHLALWSSSLTAKSHNRWEACGLPPCQGVMQLQEMLECLFRWPSRSGFVSYLIHTTFDI